MSGAHGSRTRAVEAAAVLARGGLVAFPTETVYGLGADASSATALARLFAAKGRPPTHPLIVHVGGTEGLERCAATVPPAARRLAEALWPGPLTVVVPRGVRVHPAATGGLDTVGLRCPAHPLALAVLDAFGGGVAAPSANRFGRVSPTTADDVVAELGDAVDLVLDGGPCAIGVESTIVDCTAEVPALLRLGAIGVEHLEEALRGPVVVPERPTVPAPGTLPSHYAPAADVTLVGPGELEAALARVGGAGRVAVLAPTPDLAALATPDDAVLLDLGPDGESAAHRLYGLLRQADRDGAVAIVAVAPADEGPLARAVADRLRRAAAG